MEESNRDNTNMTPYTEFNIRSILPVSIILSEIKRARMTAITFLYPLLDSDTLSVPKLHLAPAALRRWCFPYRLKS
jgi:hypothetical protein